MEKKINTLIIPDVHGRWFWKEPVEKVLAETDAHIIFLGDYLDIYPYEYDWNQDINWFNVAVDRFKSIIDLKRANPDRITLLIGNHDGGYCIGEDICSCRMDYGNKREIEKLFADNRDLFQIAEEADINGKHFVFSHAGILKGWVKRVWGEEMNREGFNVIDELNNAWLVEHYSVLDALGDYDIYRGYGGYTYGSPIWSDIMSWRYVKPESTYGYNIVGHSQLEGNEPLILPTIADLDVRKAFYLDDEGNIRDYETDEIQSIREVGEEEDDDF